MQLALLVIISSHIEPAYATDCPVSIPNMEDPDGAMKSNKYFGWYGSPKLAAMIPWDGQWLGMGAEHNFRNKFWWWREEYRANSNWERQLTLSVRNMENGHVFTAGDATNARTGSDDYNWHSMLLALEFPAAGCWEITGRFADDTLVIVVQVGH